MIFSPHSAENQRSCVITGTDGMQATVKRTGQKKRRSVIVFVTGPLKLDSQRNSHAATAI